MTLTDRKVRFEIIAKLEGKTKDEVVNKMKKIKSFFNNNLNDVIKSISTDNGTEFSAWKEIQNILNTTIYFYHPYASFEKGTNEKHNGLIRYFIPKGNLIENYSNKDINDIANWMNNYVYKKNLMLYNNIKFGNKCIFYMSICCTSFENLGIFI